MDTYKLISDIDPLDAVQAEIDRLRTLPLDDPERVIIFAFTREGTGKLALLTNLDAQVLGHALIDIGVNTLKAMPASEVN